jgi:hypothetical protein
VSLLAIREFDEVIYLKGEKLRLGTLYSARFDAMSSDHVTKIVGLNT